MRKRSKIKLSKKRNFVGGGLLLLLLLQGIPAIAQVCPLGTVQSSPTSQICVLSLGTLVCPAGTLAAFPGSHICILDPTAITKYGQALVIPPVNSYQKFRSQESGNLRLFFCLNVQYMKAILAYLIDIKYNLINEGVIRKIDETRVFLVSKVMGTSEGSG